MVQIANAYRELQHYIVNIQQTPSPQEYHLQGYVIIRTAIAEGQALLDLPYMQQPDDGDDPETKKRHLKRYVH